MPNLMQQLGPMLQGLMHGSTVRPMGVGFSPPNAGSPHHGGNAGGGPNDPASPGGSGTTGAPGPFDPGGGPGNPTMNFDPRKQTPWQRRNAAHGDTSTTLDPPSFWDTHPSKAAAARLLQKHVTDVASQRRDRMFPGWRSAPYDPNAPWMQPTGNFGMAPGAARLVGHVFGGHLPTPQRGMQTMPERKKK